MADKQYSVISQQPTVYLDEGGSPVNGFVLRVRLHKWSEVAEFNLRRLDPVLIDQRVKEFIQQREALDRLGG